MFYTNFATPSPTQLPNVKYDYKWFHNGKEVAKMTKSTYSPKSQDGEIHCTVRNQVSEKKSDVITSLCSGEQHPPTSEGRVKVNMRGRCIYGCAPKKAYVSALTNTRVVLTKLDRGQLTQG